MDEIKRLTPAQRVRCNRLIRRLCANYNGGNCLPLDDGEGCVCVQRISYQCPCDRAGEAEAAGKCPVLFSVAVGISAAAGAWKRGQSGHHGAGLPPVSDAERPENGTSAASERGNYKQAGSNFE